MAADPAPTAEAYWRLSDGVGNWVFAGVWKSTWNW